MRQSEKLAKQAVEAFNSGNPAQAASLFQNVLRLDPKHSGALDFLSHYAVQSGQFDAAIKLLVDYINLEPNNSNARRLMGEALEMKGELDAAERLYRDALIADPANHMAAIYLAMLMARRNRVDEAAQLISLVFEASPGFITVGQDPEVFPGAAQRVRAADALLRSHLAAQHREAAKASERIRNAVWPQATTKPVEYREPGQRPWLFYVPDLTAKPVHDAASVPGLAALADAADAIRSEALAGFNLETDSEPGAPGLPAGVAGDEIRSVFFYRNGVRQDALDRLPSLEKALEGLPLGRVGDAPADVRLLVFAPKAERPLLFGQSNAHLTVHLPLQVAEGEAGLDVDGTVHAWETGKPLLFDDTFEHRLVNRTEAQSVVLAFQVYNPELTQADIEAMEASFAARRAWLANRDLR